MTTINEETLSYVTPEEIKASKVGFDFSSYDDEFLLEYGKMAKEVIDQYTGRRFGSGLITETGEAVVDMQGRVVVRTRSKPIKAVASLVVWTTNSAKIDLDADYADIYNAAGYLYYSVTASLGTTYGTSYPTVVLSQAQTVGYEIQYLTESSVPGLIKLASYQIIANLLKSDYYYKETGVAGIETGVKSFHSDSFSVDFGSGTSNNSESVISNAIKEILNKYKVCGQNTI